jgi:hypothetical protein
VFDVGRGGGEGDGGDVREGGRGDTITEVCGILG